MLALATAMPKLGDHRISIFQKRCAEVRINPGTGNKPGPDLRAYIALIEIDDGIKGGRINQALFHQNGLQRLDPKRGFGRQEAVRAVVVMIMWHAVILRWFTDGCPEGSVALKWALSFGDGQPNMGVGNL